VIDTHTPPLTEYSLSRSPSGPCKLANAHTKAHTNVHTTIYKIFLNEGFNPINSHLHFVTNNINCNLCAIMSDKPTFWKWCRVPHNILFYSNEFRSPIDIIIISRISSHSVYIYGYERNAEYWNSLRGSRRGEMLK